MVEPACALGQQIRIQHPAGGRAAAVDRQRLGADFRGVESGYAELQLEGPTRSDGYR